MLTNTNRVTSRLSTDASEIRRQLGVAA